MKSRSNAIVLIVAACVVAAIGFWIWPRTFTRPSQDQHGRPPGLVESARVAGMNFRMNFLPNEQGEQFKINFYDHGCGVAVADVDGDGWDDIYMLNQLGPNALLKNQGNGTFVDIAEQAGVAFGDRICVG